MDTCEFRVKILEEDLNPRDGFLVFEGNSGGCSLSFYIEEAHGKPRGIIPDYIFLLNDFASLEFDKNDRLNLSFVGLKYRLTFIFSNEMDLEACLKVVEKYHRLVADETQARICHFAPLTEGMTIYAPFSAAVWPEFEPTIQVSERLAFQRQALPGIDMTGPSEPEKLSAEQYKALFDANGKFKDMEKFPSVFYNKDIDTTVLAEVCMLLLKPKYASMTREERLKKRVSNRQTYVDVKQQWKATTPRQWVNNVSFREVVLLLESDLKQSVLFNVFKEPVVYKQIAFDIFLSLSIWSWNNGAYLSGMLPFVIPFLHMFIKEVKHVGGRTVFVATTGDELSLDEIEGDIFWCFRLFYDAQLVDLVRPSSHTVLHGLVNAGFGILHDRLPDLLQLLYQKRASNLSFMEPEIKGWFMDCFEPRDLHRLWISILAFSSSFQFFQCFMVMILYSLVPTLIDTNPKSTAEFLDIFNKSKKQMNLNLLLTNTSKLLGVLTVRKSCPS